MRLCGWAAGSRGWLGWGWLRAAGAAQYCPGFQIQLHHTGLCLRCWPGRSRHHLVEHRENARRSDQTWLDVKDHTLLCVTCFTMHYEYVQSLRVAEFSCDPQRSHPINVSGSYFSSVSKEQHQNIRTAHLMQEVGSKEGKEGQIKYDIKAGFWSRSLSCFSRYQRSSVHLCSFVGCCALGVTHLLHKGPAHDEGCNHVVWLLPHRCKV